MDETIVNCKEEFWLKNDERPRKMFLAMWVTMWSTMEKNSRQKMCQYSSTTLFIVLRVCSVRKQTNTRINQSSIDATMMQQTTTTKTTQWIIIETYQHFESNQWSSLSIMKWLKNNQDNGWMKRLWIARSVYCNDKRVRKVLAMRVIMWSTTEKSFTPKKMSVLKYQYFYCSTCLQSTYTNVDTN